MADFSPDETGLKDEALGTAATQEAFWARDKNGERFRLKLNPPERLLNTFHEVMSSRLLHAVGLPASPLTSWVHGQDGRIWIASPEVKGATDIGLFLIDEGIKHAAQANKEAYRCLLASYAQGQASAAALRGAPSMGTVMGCYKKGAFKSMTPEHHQLVQPLRDQERKLLQLEDKMFALLPPKFHSALLKAAYASEVVGEWDFLNHLRYNTVIAVDRCGQVNVQTVDRGVSGLVGFSGKLKTNNQEEAKVPARTDDPYAGHQKKSLQSYSPYGAIDARMGDLDFRKVSRTFGQVGSIPRSAPMAFIFKKTIVAERDRLAPPPKEALEVAAQLKLVDPATINLMVHKAYDDVQQQAQEVWQTLFLKAGSGVDSAQALCDLYQERIRAIIARAS